MLSKIATVVLVIIITGCSDPKAANEKNFQTAIQSYLNTAYPKCYFNENFPTTTADFDLRGNKEVLKALAKAGLLTEKELSRKETITSFSGKKQTIVSLSYDLTDEGRKFYKTDAMKTYSGAQYGGFCIGKATVKSVTQFSEPADMFGQKISRVNYTYVVSDLPAWTKSPEVTAAIRSLKADVESETTPIKALNTLLLTNNGWVHEKFFKK